LEFVNTEENSKLIDEQMTEKKYKYITLSNLKDVSNSNFILFKVKLKMGSHPLNLFSYHGVKYVELFNYVYIYIYIYYNLNMM